MTDETLEAARVALASHLLALRLHASGAPVADQAHGLPLQVGEILQPTGEENGAQVGDVVAVGLVPLDEPVVGESFQNGVASIRGRDSEQVEIGRIVQDLEDVLAGQVLGGDVLFEGMLQQEAPELPFLGRVVSQLSRRAADADELGPPEGHRSARRAFDLEQDQQVAGLDSLNMDDNVYINVYRWRMMST